MGGDNISCLSCIESSMVQVRSAAEEQEIP